MTHKRGCNSSLSFILTVVVVLILAVAFEVRAQDAQNLFLPPVQYYFDAIPNLVTVVDMDSDGRIDLLVSGDAALGSFGVLLGNGDGTFRHAGVYYESRGRAGRAVVADLNGDNRPDVVIPQACSDSTNCTQYETRAGVFLGNGDGTFQPMLVYKTGGYQSASSVAVGDLNGDGKPDLAVANWRYTSVGFEGCVSVLLGNGDGTFQLPVVYDSAGSNADTVTETDVNGDGHLDLLVLDSGAHDSVGVLLGNGDGTFKPAVAYGSGGAWARDLTVTDVNRDGSPDLVVANVLSNSIGVLLGEGDGTFQQAVVVNSGGPAIASTAVADMNGDGTADLVVAYCGTQTTIALQRDSQV